MRGMDIFWNHTMVQKVFYYKFGQELEGLSLRAGGWGFPPTDMNVVPGYSHWKIEEKFNQKKSLAVWFPAYLLYFPGNSKS